jgi:lipopolysaccharide biosynthesis protein
MDPFTHYIKYGILLRRSPSPRFDPLSYLNKNQDVAHSGVDPTIHYINFGISEGRQAGSESSSRCSVHSPSSEGKLKAYADQIFKISKYESGINLDYVPKTFDRFNLSRAEVKVIAFYLPQFHPIPENDEWWGRGFTEWTNVTKAMPQYLGHYQPRLPGELGFYDLRLVDVMRQQADLAKTYGIGGFCFHHYWFGGKRLLERPVNQFLNATDIDFPFCLCWANENWTRRWDGQEEDILLAQSHSPEDDIAFIEHIMPAFRDKRYIRFDGRPVLLVYRVSLLPDPKATALRWRQRCIDAGLGDLYLVAARSFEITDPRPFGFDASIEFPPHQIPSSRINDQLTIVNPKYAGNIYSYEELAAGYAAQRVDEYPLIKTVSPSWDNEARKPGAGHVFHGASPAVYAKWLRSVYSTTVEKTERQDIQPPFVFVNAWNEWAEGAYLEPDRKYGYAYLHATANIIRDFLRPEPEVEALVKRSQENFARRSDVAIVLHLHYDDLFSEIAPYIHNVRNADIFISLKSDVEAARCRDILTQFPRARLAIYPNRGRDIQPFLQTLRLLQSAGYEVGCKVHSKRSPQRNDGATLRKHALESLLASSLSVDSLLERFRADPRAGILAPKGSLLWLGEPDRYILNKRWLDHLFQLLGNGELVDNYRCKFVAGSMFWFRVRALEPLVRSGIGELRFEDELGQVDGTLAHALERLFAVVSEASGYTVSEI